MCLFVSLYSYSISLYIHYIYINIVYIYIYFTIFRKWKPNQPDNWLGSQSITEDCAHLHSNGLLNDLHCFERLRYICQTHAHRV